MNRRRRCDRSVRRTGGGLFLCDDEPGHGGSCWSNLLRRAGQAILEIPDSDLPAFGPPTCKFHRFVYVDETCPDCGQPGVTKRAGGSSEPGGDR